MLLVMLEIVILFIWNYNVQSKLGLELVILVCNSIKYLGFGGNMEFVDMYTFSFNNGNLDVKDRFSIGKVSPKEDVF